MINFNTSSNKLVEREWGQSFDQLVRRQGVDAQGKTPIKPMLFSLINRSYTIHVLAPSPDSFLSVLAQKVVIEFGSKVVQQEWVKRFQNAKDRACLASAFVQFYLEQCNSNEKTKIPVSIVGDKETLIFVKKVQYPLPALPQPQEGNPFKNLGNLYEQERLLLLSKETEKQAVYNDYHYCCYTKPRSITMTMPLSEHEKIKTSINQLATAKFYTENVIRQIWNSEYQGKPSVAYSQEEFWNYVLTKENNPEWGDLRARWDQFKETTLKGTPVDELALQEKLFWVLEENQKFESQIFQHELAFTNFAFNEASSELFRLLNLYDEHCFSRFKLFLRVHKCFLDGYKALLNLLDIDVMSKNYVHKIAVANITKADADKKQFYRVIQGGHNKDKNFCKQKSKFAYKLKPLFESDQVKPYQMENAHTIPFPGIFSWNVVETAKNDDEILQVSQLQKYRVTKHALKLSTEDFSTSMKKEIQTLLSDKYSNKVTQAFLQDALYLISRYSLILASETEHLPGFFNEMDQQTEVKVCDRIKGKKYGYKQLITLGLTKLMEKTHTVSTTDLKEIWLGHEYYLGTSSKSVSQSIAKIEKNASCDLTIIQLAQLHCLYSMKNGLERYRSVYGV